MAIDNTKTSFAKMEFPLAMKRQDGFSLDPTEVWPSLKAAQEYAKNDPTAYVGQELAVVVDGVSTRYLIKNAAGDLEPSGGSIDESLIATDNEATEMLDEVFADVETDEESVDEASE